MFSRSASVGSHASPDDGCRLTEENKFQLLKNNRRRQIIEYLLEREGTTTTRSELAELIAANENGVTVSELGSDQRKRVYVSLYQTHLPALDGADVVQYDANRGTVEAGPNLHELVPYLRGDAAPREMSESVPYLVLSVVAGVTFVLIRSSEPSVPWLAELWAIGLVSAIFLWSVYHLNDRPPFGSIVATTLGRLVHRDDDTPPEPRNRSAPADREPFGGPVASAGPGRTDDGEQHPT